jgi:excisionase family DNA binding protein
MKRKNLEHETWLELAEAAEYLGVHFSTLRRWADAGEIPFLRTPGKRRRFTLAALEAFLQQRKQGSANPLALAQPLQERAIDHARTGLRNMPVSESWFGRLNEAQRAGMRGTGHRLMALLLQYNSRQEGGEVFLEEGKRILRDYGQVCQEIGLSLPETVRIFLFFRRSILDAVHETGSIGGREDQTGLHLYHRTTDFLDELIVELIGGYQALSKI